MKISEIRKELEKVLPPNLVLGKRFVRAGKFYYPIFDLVKRKMVTYLRYSPIATFYERLVELLAKKKIITKEQAVKMFHYEAEGILYLDYSLTEKEKNRVKVEFGFKIKYPPLVRDEDVKAFIELSIYDWLEGKEEFEWIKNFYDNPMARKIVGFTKIKRERGKADFQLDDVEVRKIERRKL